MTEEENKAIECLKIVADDINECGAEYYIDKDILSDIKTALNLIEKLKNKVVKRDNEIIQLEESAEKEFLTKQEVKENYIPKDKIEKIKNKNIGQYINFYREIEELLEEKQKQ